MYNGDFLWNNLPGELQTAGSLGLFKEALVDGFLHRTPTRQMYVNQFVE